MVPALMVLLSFSAFAADPAEGIPEEPPVTQVPATEAQQAVHRQLSARHALPCEEVEAVADNAVTDLLWAVDNAPMPPWAGMRAAECLMAGHPEAIEAQLLEWVSKPEYKGLGRLVLIEIDKLPTEQAVRVGTKAVLEGSDPEMARGKLAKSSKPEIKALADLAAP